MSAAAARVTVLLPAHLKTLAKVDGPGATSRCPGR